jgi:hypothetical protein
MLHTFNLRARAQTHAHMQGEAGAVKVARTHLSALAMRVRIYKLDSTFRLGMTPASVAAVLVFSLRNLHYTSIVHNIHRAFFLSPSRSVHLSHAIDKSPPAITPSLFVEFLLSLYQCPFSSRLSWQYCTFYPERGRSLVIAV